MNCLILLSLAVGQIETVILQGFLCSAGRLCDKRPSGHDVSSLGAKGPPTADDLCLKGRHPERQLDSSEHSSPRDSHVDRQHRMVGKVEI